MARQPCRFYQSQKGCWKGQNCQFAHVATIAPEAVGSPSSSEPTGRRNGPHTQLGSRAQVPFGVCRYYWANGQCNRNNACSFKHVREHKSQSRPQVPRGTMSNAAKEMVAPFLTENGLANIYTNATDSFFAESDSSSLSPSDAQRRLKSRYLLDGFKFKASFEIYPFLEPLCSANPGNPQWTQEEGQLLLATLTATNGCLRIAEIINWPEISIEAGMKREALSFQRGILPLLRYMSSEYVIKSTLITHVNRLYTVVLQNLSRFADVVESYLNQAIKSQSFGEPKTLLRGPIDVQVFASMASVLHEFLVRFKNAIASYPRLSQLVKTLSETFRDWHSGITTRPDAFGNSLDGLQPAARELLLGSIKEKVDKLTSILEREEGKVMVGKDKRDRITSTSAPDPQSGLIALLHTTYEGPGHLREKGPRHDNDFDDIYDIRIAPTNKELLCRLPPFLPANIFGAPHPAPPDSMQRLLDIQFRLLREELTAPLRMAIQLVHDDLEWMQTNPNNRRKLRELLQKQGGKYRSSVDVQDSVMFNVYTGVQFRTLVPDRKGISVKVIIDTPPGRARSGRPGGRVSYWESVSGKRLSQGGLIALVWKSGRRTTVHLGVIASSSRDLTEFVRSNSDYIELRIIFFDAEVELRILQDLRNKSQTSSSDTKLLLESPVMFEAIRPFLQALQTEPEDIPFSRYLVQQPAGQLREVEIQPPQYARLPNFKFQLSSLFDAKAGVDELTLSVTDRESVQHARTQLRGKSRLDPSQADAVVDALTREIALIQGPPGTGKSFTGVEILRVLRANNIGPILMIAFTNHALDHILCSVLDADITKKIVRLGRRSADERIAQYSIETLEMAQRYSRLDHNCNVRRDLKSVQEDIASLMNKVLKVDIENDSAEITKYMSAFHPEHHNYFSNPPEWLSNVRTYMDDREDDAGEWQTAGPNGRLRAHDTSNYAFWKECRDLAFITQITSDVYSRPKPTTDNILGSQNAFSTLPIEDVEDEQESESDLDSDDPDDDLDVEESWKAQQYGTIPAGMDDVSDDPPSSADSSISQINSVTDEPLQRADFRDPNAFFVYLGFDDAPSIPSTDRPLKELLNDVGDVWSMSQSERQRVHRFWVEETRKELRESSMCEFQRLRDHYAQKLREASETSAEVRRTLLQKIDIIGCTTTGAAQLTTLLRGLGPKVLLVEEAGQVMEAHILGTLVPSIEQLILIGDPLQLRPTLNNYSLSMDNRRGRALYKFDMSLMERLSTSGLAMSRIDVQRRMRPAISSLIRNTLYPTLEDHDLVRNYPDVRGIQKNLFFVTHQHRENDGGDDTASKYNTYEVAMISDLVLYLLRQGCYSNEGDIVVLCAYLGQLARLRDALKDEVAVIIDERDQAALDDQECDSDQQGPGEVSIERVNVTKMVRLRTVDNYQGEEGRIIILSLVRNAGGLEDDHEMQRIRPASIGFLKSENRTNVALSRAREGLFIFGNAENLRSRSDMWGSIIEELESNDCLGPALPIACQRHPDTVEYISKPGTLPQFAPDGGCLRPCETRLKCGHNCPFKCHCDDPNHVTVVCTQPCRRLCAAGNHPCKRQCSTNCGDCVFPIENVELPCGHIKASVECHRLDTLDTVYCDFQMEKSLPTCEHSAVMACGRDPSEFRCTVRCGLAMKCCSKSCNAPCHGCQSENIPQLGEKTMRNKHRTHSCETSLHCGHRCQEHCSEGHNHTVKCNRPCRQNCVHAKCRQPCSTLCAPCQEPCAWVCPHYSCPVPCGSICVRLPCDLPCTNRLACGHKCPSVCGEECSIQVCPECAPAHQKDQVVDLILSRTLSDIMPELGGLDDLVITNPSCRHVFTVETLDGLTEITEFYSRDRQDVKWIGLKAPVGVVKSPSCPTCRAPIASNRYGRIIKRANLDILERNVASHMSESLSRWLSSTKCFDEDMARKILATTSTVRVSGSEKLPAQQKLNKARKMVLGNTNEKPASYADIRADNKKLHRIDSAVLDAWHKATSPLFQQYREIVKIADTRSAHTQAWEASFSFLYEREIEAGLQDPLKMPRNPEQHAMRMARLQVGQPRPLADRRFLVEAFWGSIHVRLTLIRLAQTWLDRFTIMNLNHFHIQQWATYIDFLLKTCSEDAAKAFTVAANSKSSRQMIRSVLHCLRVELEAFRFNLHMCKKFGSFEDSDTRNALCEKASELERSQMEMVASAIEEYLEIGSSPEDIEWVEENFTSTARAILDEWNKIEESIRLDTFYQPVSLEEKMDIIRSFSFETTGHFYTCPNGHIYTITECGGAMERSRCPECGEVIGGENHHLVPTNQVANEFDELARNVNPNVSRPFWAVPY